MTEWVETDAHANAMEPHSPRVASPTERMTLPIRWVVSAASVLLTLTVTLGVGFVAERNARRALTDELVDRLCVQASNVALAGRSAFLTPFPELTLHPILLGMSQRDRSIALATVCDQSGTIVGDADA